MSVPQHKVRQERTEGVILAPSITTPMAIGSTERVGMLKMQRRTPTLTAEMTDITSVATTRYLFPERAPPIASPPQMKKTGEVQIPVK